MKLKLYIILLILAFIYLPSCKTITKVEKEYIYRDSIQLRTDIVRDTITEKDSIVVFAKGDTIYQERYQVIYKSKEVVKTDTIYLNNDKVQTIEKTTTKKVIPLWCWLILIGVLIYLIYKLYKFLKK